MYITFKGPYEPPGETRICEEIDIACKHRLCKKKIPPEPLFYYEKLPVFKIRMEDSFLI